jgi:chitin deacetylase
MLSSVLTFGAFLVLTAATAVPHKQPHFHEAERSLPKRWFHQEDHPVHSLFRRGGDGQTYEEVGSPTWAAAYPEFTPDSSKMPQAWKDALKAAQDAGKIPNIPVATSTGGNPTYPGGLDPAGKEVCSATSKCREPQDIWDTPEGYFGTGFDDGPWEGSSKLYDFLEQNNIDSTHFMIGVYIKQNPDNFLRAFQKQGSDIAVHTYTHPYMTTLSNEDVVAQLAWTMEIIHNSTQGRVPRYWRPPYGDADNRVRAIAKEVLGLDMIMWNHDTEDWSMGEPGGTTMQKINASFTEWINGPKNPGLIVLEHELTADTVQAFMDAVPNIQAAGWKMVSVAQLADNNTDNGQAGVWQNAADNNGDVTPQPVGSAAPSSSAASGGASASSMSPGSPPSGTPSGSHSSSGSSPSQTPDGSALSSSSIPRVSFLLLISLVMVLL